MVGGLTKQTAACRAPGQGRGTGALISNEFSFYQFEIRIFHVYIPPGGREARSAQAVGRSCAEAGRCQGSRCGGWRHDIRQAMASVAHDGCQAGCRRGPLTCRPAVLVMRWAREIGLRSTSGCRLRHMPNVCRMGAWRGGCLSARRLLPWCERGNDRPGPCQRWKVAIPTA